MTRRINPLVYWLVVLTLFGLAWLTQYIPV